MLNFFFLILVCGQVADHSFSSEAYKPSPAPAIGEISDYFHEGFESYPNQVSPWGGYRPWNWLVFDSFASTGERALIGLSGVFDGNTYTISPRFNVPPQEPVVVAEAFLKITSVGSTWQFVPQGAGFVTARMIILPEGQVAVFDADTGPQPLRLPYFIELGPRTEHVKCTFVIERFRNRYSLLLNDQRVYTGTPFTTELEHVVFDCDLTASPNIMSIDDVSVRPLNANVPTLQTWALFALCGLLLVAALWQQRTHQAK